MWPKENVHNLFACRISGCFCLSRKEQEGLRVAEDAEKKENKKPDKYKHDWTLNPRYWSICYVENHGLSLQCSNAWPERGGSVINITKTKFRNRLNNEMLNSLMQVSINGPESKQCSDVVKSPVDNWIKQKPRKKLKNANCQTPV